MRFPESALAHELLDGLVGIEIGGAAHNAFGLDTWNVDQLAPGHPDIERYDAEQRRMCGEVMTIDVVSLGDRLPFRTDSLDFVVTSHVIEHFYDPIAALAEWARVARRYLFIICPQPDALHSDSEKPLTALDEHLRRNAEPASTTVVSDVHHSRWTAASFQAMCEASGYCITHVEDPDAKVGNGFTIVIALDDPATSAAAGGWRRRSLDVARRLTERLNRSSPA
jgi:SAM-dependent methyltransferase